MTDQYKPRHKNQHEWCWMPEFGSYFQYCELCHRAEDASNKGKYYTHKQALIIVLEKMKSHPANCDCEICSQGGREAQEYYRKYYRISP